MFIYRPNDGYALLAAHLLLDAWNNDPRILLKCLTLLEKALLVSPANYHLKLLTTRVYTVAGCGCAAEQHYNTLDVKYIQLDSLGHLLCRPLISMGLPYSASSILANTLKFYTTHAREVTLNLLFTDLPPLVPLSSRLNCGQFSEDFRVFDCGLQVRIVQQDTRVHQVQPAAWQFAPFRGRHYRAHALGLAAGEPVARQTRSNSQRNVCRSWQGSTGLGLCGGQSRSWYSRFMGSAVQVYINILFQSFHKF